MGRLKRGDSDIVSRGRDRMSGEIATGTEEKINIWKEKRQVV